MTVCIAALAEDSRAIVLASDKATTIGAMRDDTDAQKILPIASGWAALTSGNGGRCDAVVRAISALASVTPGITDDATLLGHHVEQIYQTLRNKTVEQEVLSSHLLDMTLYSARPNTLLPLPESVVTDVRRDLRGFDFDVDLLVCGFDVHRRANLILISSKGLAVNVTNEGFFAIGSGLEAAAGRLLWQGFTRRRPLERVLYEVFDAKAHAELIEGVGYFWDAAVIVPGQILTPPRRVLSTIEALFMASTESPFEKQPKHVPRQWQAILEAYRHDVMKKATVRQRRRRRRSG